MEQEQLRGQWQLISTSPGRRVASGPRDGRGSPPLPAATVHIAALPPVPLRFPGVTFSSGLHYSARGRRWVVGPPPVYRLAWWRTSLIFLWFPPHRSSPVATRRAVCSRVTDCGGSSWWYSMGCPRERRRSLVSHPALLFALPPAHHLPKNGVGSKTATLRGCHLVWIIARRPCSRTARRSGQGRRWRPAPSASRALCLQRCAATRGGAPGTSGPVKGWRSPRTCGAGRAGIVRGEV